MARIISASIDLNKIDKSRIVHHKNGGRYYDIDIAVNDQPNQFGQDSAIMQGQTKEERVAKEKRVYLGNGKTVWRSSTEVSAQRPQVVASPNTEPIDGPTDDLPF